MPHAFSRTASLAIAVLAAGMLACGDDVTDPDAILDSAEAEAIARSAAALPAFADLVREGQPAGIPGRVTLDRAGELWAAGMADPDGRGPARRRLAAAHAAPILAGTVSPADWDAARAGMEEWTGTAERLIRRLPLPAVEERLRAARGHLERADRATTAESRVYHLMLALSELVETTPRHVARSLAADADTAVRRAEADGARPGPALQRARRLSDWATRAVEEEDYMRAIQRAYYAIQLAEAR